MVNAHLKVSHYKGLVHEKYLLKKKLWLFSARRAENLCVDKIKIGEDPAGYDKNGARHARRIQAMYCC